jgi:hypothetical protein
MKHRILKALLIAGVGILMAGCATTEKEGKEVQVKLADCPKPVQDTLAKEAPGAQITVVDKEEEKGKATYEADAVLNGKNYEIRVAADGTLILKKLDEEKKNEKDEKEDGPKK